MKRMSLVSLVAVFVLIGSAGIAKALAGAPDILQPVPGPSNLLLLGSCLAGFALWGRRRFGVVSLAVDLGKVTSKNRIAIRRRRK